MVENFSITLHVASVIGLVVSVFGIPYSPLAVFLYGGHLLYDNGGEHWMTERRYDLTESYYSHLGAVLLSLYCVYLSIMAVNGITECFAMASMSNAQVRHKSVSSECAVPIPPNIVLGVFSWKLSFLICNRTHSSQFLLVFIPERVWLHYCQCCKYVVPNRIQVE